MTKDNTRTARVRFNGRTYRRKITDVRRYRDNELRGYATVCHHHVAVIEREEGLWEVERVVGFVTSAGGYLIASKDGHPFGHQCPMCEEYETMCDWLARSTSVGADLE